MKYLVLFASSTTLLCCALPALLVFLGFGAVVASVVSTLPFLITLSEYKIVVFSVSGIMIGTSWFFLSQVKACSINDKKEACIALKSTSKKIIILSSIIWFIGFAISIIIPRFL